jgi:hypothetical protein
MEPILITLLSVVEKEGKSALERALSLRERLWGPVSCRVTPDNLPGLGFTGVRGTNILSAACAPTKAYMTSGRRCLFAYYE